MKTKENSIAGSKNRKIYLDLVKIFAIFLVYFTHTGSYGPKLYTICDVPWKQFGYVMVDCFRTINNLLLFMVSGALLLGKNEHVLTVCKKRVLRFLAALIIFSLLQSAYRALIVDENGAFQLFEIFKMMVQKPVKGSYWYLHTYIAFLVMLPFLRPIAQKMDFSQFIYLIVCVTIVKDIFPILIEIFQLEKINFSIFVNSTYIFYPLVGFYLDTHWEEMQQKYSWMYAGLFGLAVAGVVLAAGLTMYSYRMTDAWSEKYITTLSTFVAMFVFVTLKNNCAKACLKADSLLMKVSGGIVILSGAAFGLYLLEEQFKGVTRVCYSIFNQWLPSILADCLWVIVAMAVGTVVIAVLKKIPGIKQLI